MRTVVSRFQDLFNLANKQKKRPGFQPFLLSVRRPGAAPGGGAGIRVALDSATTPPVEPAKQQLQPPECRVNGLVNFTPVLIMGSPAITP